MSHLQGKVALVTGASRGVGAAVAEMLAERGADVVMNYPSKSRRAEDVAERVRAHGGTAFPAQADLTNETEMHARMHRIRQQFGRLDLLVLNASGGLEANKPAGYSFLSSASKAA